MKICPTCASTYPNNVAFCPRDGAALRSAEGLQPGAIIRDKYQILSEIGRGGMGVVYKARHLIWNEDKAIKVLTAVGDAAQPGLKSLMAEARLMRHVQHPNIVRVEDADTTEDGQPFVVMEYVDGESLRERLNRLRTLSPAAALGIAAQVCSALAAVHERGVIHRDIKPQNLLLTKGPDGSDTVRVIDFGIAKVREDAGLGYTGMLTSTTGQFIRTVTYASPEQAAGMSSSDLDGRTDLYSLGLVLYEMLAGRLPFVGNEPLVILMQRLLNPPAPLEGAGLPTEVATLVMKALEKERERRYASCTDMQQAIAAILDKWKAQEQQDTVSLAVPASSKVQTRVNPLDGLTYVYIPPGEFTMGCSPGDTECHDNEEPAHHERIAEGFWLSQTPVTQAAWKKVMGNNPSHLKGDQLPVESVDWDQAASYCKAVAGRLPTEKEWEYAARAGTTSARYGPLDEVAWYRGNSGGRKHAVGSKQPNAFGLYDMLGSVWEWTADNYDAAGRYRVLRGGSFNNLTGGVRASGRLRVEPTRHSRGIGFRCVAEFR